MMTRLTCAALCVLAIAPLSARANWTKWSEGDSTIYLNAVSAPDPEHVFIAGDSIVVNGTSIVAHPHIFSSSDRGHNFTDISGNLSSLTGYNASASAIAFIDAQTGWLAIGPKIYRTSDGGAHWASGVTVTGNTTAIHGFDRDNVVRAGSSSATAFSTNGGTAWTPGSGVGSGLTFVSLFFADRQHGWATANAMDSNTGISNEVELFRTTDGGATWTETWNQSALGAGPVFFLADGQTGWIATYEQTGASSDPPDPWPAKVHLFRTTNGGDDLTDVGLPTQVGTTKGLFNTTSPIDFARVYAMYWDDAQHGHLVGGAFLGSATSGSSGGMSSVSQTKTSWRVADYRTTDGSSWNDRTSLGTITVSTTLPPSDGQFTTGFFLDAENGWLVADSQAVWGYEKTCSSSSACAAGYTCTAGHCVREAISAPGTDGGSVTHPGGSDGGGFTIGGKPDTVATGCHCGQGSPAGLLLLPLLGGLLRRRRPLPAA